MRNGRFEREHIILFIAVVILIAIALKNVLTPAISAGSPISAGIQETNLGGLRVMDNQSPKTITYGDGATEYFPNSFAGLFINGSIIENANIVIENNRALGPARLIAERLGAGVDWDAGKQTIIVRGGDIKIELAIGERTAKLNGTPMTIDAAPRIINDYAYVPIRFMAESLNCRVDWFDGTAAGIENGPRPHYVLRMKQVMVSRYPAGVKAMSAPEAVQTVKSLLAVAYEKKFHIVYEPLIIKPEVWNERDSMRYSIANLSVSSENDRFYIVPMTVNFMIDKYTGTVFVFNDGDIQTIDKFDPNAPDAPAFAQ